MKPGHLRDRTMWCVEYRILVFSHAAGYSHASTPDGIRAIEGLGRRNGFGVDSTTDPRDFNDANLAHYAAVVFLNTTGNVLAEQAQRSALEDYIHAGGGFFGIHAAADMGAVARSWPFYRGLVGACFKGHTTAHLWGPIPIPLRCLASTLKPLGIVYEGAVGHAPADSESHAKGLFRSVSWEPAVVTVEDPRSPMMTGWGETEMRTDEWYGFAESPRPNVHVVASVREETYDPAKGSMGLGAADHPIAWSHRWQGGRAVYTAMGHHAALWRDPMFLTHILGGIRVAAGADLDGP